MDGTRDGTWTKAARTALVAALLALAVVGFGRPASAQAPSTSATASPPAGPAPPYDGRTLVVGTHPVAPFVVANPDGTWSGISIDLWKKIADDLGYKYEIKKFEVPTLLAPDPSIDVVVSLNINSRSEQTLDLSHAFYSTGLAIATRPEPANGWLEIGRKLLTKDFLGALAILLTALLLTGSAMYLLERKRNPDEFGGGVLSGVVNGVFWSLESLVGSADRPYRSRAGRTLGLLWVFFCVVLISGVTAEMSAKLTVNSLSTSVSGPDDLPKVKVGTVKPSQGARYLDARHISFKVYPDAMAALGALDRGEVTAVVYESPILRYHANNTFKDKVIVLPGTFENHGYGFGLRQGSPLRESINRAVLKYVETEDYQRLLRDYLGEP
jgi:ABC-type amino acid transport substrate-binding protein